MLRSHHPDQIFMALRGPFAHCIRVGPQIGQEQSYMTVRDRSQQVLCLGLPDRSLWEKLVTVP